MTAIARGRRWLDELIANLATNPDSIAKREGCTARQVNLMISLAFLAPDLVKAAIEGKLPHGMGVRRLRDMPPEWSRQRQTSASSEILPAIRSSATRLEFSARNQDLEGGDFASKSGSRGKCCLYRDHNSDKKPAAQRVFGGFQEPRAFAMVRGGAGRTLTSSQTIIILNEKSS